MKNQLGNLMFIDLFSFQFIKPIGTDPDDWRIQKTQPGTLPGNHAQPPR